MILQHELISLRALEPEDLDLLYSIENNRNNWSVSSTTAPYSRYALKQHIAMQPQDIRISPAQPYADKRPPLLFKISFLAMPIGKVTPNPVTGQPRRSRKGPDPGNCPGVRTYR